MTSVTAVGFATPDAAGRALHRIEGPVGRRLGVHDAAVVRWPIGSPRPDAWQAESPQARLALTGAFWGLLLGHLFLLPLSRSEPEGPVPSPDGALGIVGLGADRLDSIRGLVGPGASALLLLHADETTTGLVRALAHTVGSCSVTLTSDQSLRLYAGFGRADQQ